MELLIALTAGLGLAVAGLRWGADSRVTELERPRPWWPGRRLDA